MRRDALFLQSKTFDFQKIGQDLNTTYFREVGSSDNDLILNTQKDTKRNIRQLNKTHGAMIRYADAEDEDLQIILRILEKIVAEIEDMES